MFRFLGMANNYESRKVDRYEGEDGLSVDTCSVSDSNQPYETGIAHPAYNGGRWIIVEMYESKKAAIEGHEKWVSTMVSENLPTELRDVSTSGMANLCDMFDIDNDWRSRSLEVNP